MSSNTTLTIAAGSTSSTGAVTITARDNDVDAPNKSVIVSGTANGGGVTNPADQTLTITDDEDLPTVALTLDPTSISESGSGNTSTITATLSGKSHEAVTVEVEAAPGTDTLATDYELSSNTTLTIAAGSTSSTGAVTITAVDNDVDAPNKSVTVSGTASGGGVANPTAQTLTIADDEGVPTVTLNLSSNSINESGSGNASTVTATLSGKVSEMVEVDVAVPAGSPVTQNGSKLTFAAESTTSTGTVKLTALDNDVDAANKTITVSGTVSEDKLVDPAAQTLTIVDDDVRGVTLTATQIVVDESDNSGTPGALEHQSEYTIVLDSEPSGGSVKIQISIDDDNVATIDTKSIEFEANNWDKPQTITVEAVSDDIDNVGNIRTAQITHTLSATGTDYAAITSVPSIDVTVNDDDGTPVVSLVLTPLNVKENGGSTEGVATVTATMSGASSQEVSLAVSATPNSPATNDDFRLTGTTLTIAAGSRTSTGQVTIAAVNNEVDTDDKTITVSAVASGGNGVNSPTSKSLTIEDDDGRGVTISASTVTLPEEDDASTQGTKENQVEYTIKLDSEPTGSVVVNITSKDTKVATVNKDSVTFSPSTWQTAQSVTVTAVPDNIDNANNKRITTISHTVSAANTDYDGVNANNVDVTINDDDDKPTISVDSPEVEEGDGENTQTMEFTVTLAPQSSSVVTVDFADTGTGTATAGVDYEKITAGTLTFAPEENSKKISVTVKPDNDDENDETIVIRLSNPVNANLLNAASTLDSTGTIKDNDEVPQVSISNAEEPVIEGDDPEITKEMVFIVSMNAASANEVVMGYQLGGTASAGSDYVEPKKMSVSIETGKKTASIKIPIKGDTITEGQETITVTLMQAQNENTNFSAEQGLSVGSGTIIDDDFSVSPALGEIYEGETLTYTVSGIDASYTSLSLKVGNSSSASLGSDFKLLNADSEELAANHAFSPNDGAIKFKVNALIDSETESDETIVLRLEDSTNTFSSQLGVLTLLDGTRPVAGVEVSKESITLIEGGPSGEYTLVLTKAPDPGTTVSITASSSLPSAVGVSTSSGDANTLIFTEDNWNSPQTVTVIPLLDDDTADANASITHSVQGSGSYASVSADSVAVFVADAGPGMSIADAEAEEGEYLQFSVALSAPSPGRVAVEWHTMPLTAESNIDYEAVSTGTIKFDAGEQTKTVQVLALADIIEEPTEHFNVHLSNPVNSTLDNETATGTIFNVQTSTKKWIARFGRTVAEQLLDSIDSRIQYNGTQGIEGTFAGASFSNQSTGYVQFEIPREDCGFGALSNPRINHKNLHRGLCADTEVEYESISLADALDGSSFTSTTEYSYGDYSSIWGRAVKSGFESNDGTTSVGGEVFTGMVGTDWLAGDSRIGVIVSHSEGDGEITQENGAAGKVSSRLTALSPWVADKLTDRVTIWGAAGYGEGELTIGAVDEQGVTTGMDWTMLAAGVRGALVEATKDSGFNLDFATDAFWTRTATDNAPGIRKEAAEVTRIRAKLEGGWAFHLENDSTLSPHFELGVRHDGGDAETGFGIDFGGGLAWSAPNRGVAFELEGRSLLTHENDDFRNWSYAAKLVYDPKPATRMGFSSSIGYEWDQSASSGIDALLDEGVSNLSTDKQGEVQTQFNFAYGYELGGSWFIASPYFGYGYSDSSREYKLGWQLIPLHQYNYELSLNFVATHTIESGVRPRNGIAIEISARW